MRKNEAVRAKDLGNGAYKKKDFSTAIKFYETALNLDPDEWSYWGNLAAVMMKTQAYREVNICRSVSQL